MHMSKYLIRLDDASPKCNLENWKRVEKLLDKYKIKPIVGVIPKIEDPSFQSYEDDINFWSKARRWENKGWAIAMHGYEHVYHTDQGGINPIHHRSEFAGLPLAVQKSKVASGVEILRKEGINPRIFFAPSHTFDDNTLIALKEESDIRIISDTIALNIYYDKDFFFVPQQSGEVRRLPFKITTFCYHPNTMRNADFMKLEKFLALYKHKFTSMDRIKIKKRKMNYLDILARKIYYLRRL